MKNTTLTLESYTALKSEEETAKYMINEANQDISDCLARGKME